MSRKSVEEIYAEVKAESEARRAPQSEMCANCKRWQGVRDEQGYGTCDVLTDALRHWDRFGAHKDGTARYQSLHNFGCNKWEKHDA